jgi:hypothetical protein
VSSFGIVQAVLFFGSGVLILQVSSNYLLLVFAMGTPRFHCDTPNVTCEANQCCQNCTSYVFDGPFTSIVNEVLEAEACFPVYLFIVCLL